MSEIDKSWHLAETHKEIEIAEFELLLWRVFHGFLKWQEECEYSANNNDLTGNELSVLHLIRMRDRPKTVADIANLLNREDTFNITYSIKKLLKMGLIERAKGSTKRGTTYRITEAGIKNTDTFTRARNSTLIEAYKKEPDIDLPELIKTFIKVKSIYDEAAKLAAFYKDSEQLPDEKK